MESAFDTIKKIKSNRKFVKLKPQGLELFEE